MRHLAIVVLLSSAAPAAATVLSISSRLSLQTPTTGLDQQVRTDDASAFPFTSTVSSAHGVATGALLDGAGSAVVNSSSPALSPSSTDITNYFNRSESFHALGVAATYQELVPSRTVRATLNFGYSSIVGVTLATDPALDAAFATAVVAAIPNISYIGDAGLYAWSSFDVVFNEHSSNFASYGTQSAELDNIISVGQAVELTGGGPIAIGIPASVYTRVIDQGFLRPFSLVENTFDAPGGTYGATGIYSLDVIFDAGNRYNIGFSTTCRTSMTATSVYVAGNEAVCSASYSAPWFGLSNIRDLDGNAVGDFALTEFAEISPPPPPPAGDVPEPSTWALFVAGFGLVGRVLRRRAAAA